MLHFKELDIDTLDEKVTWNELIYINKDSIIDLSILYKCLAKIVEENKYLFELMDSGSRIHSHLFIITTSKILIDNDRIDLLLNELNDCKNKRKLVERVVVVFHEDSVIPTYTNTKVSEFTCDIGVGLKEITRQWANHTGREEDSYLTFTSYPEVVFSNHEHSFKTKYLHKPSLTDYVGGKFLEKYKS